MRRTPAVPRLLPAMTAALLVAAPLRAQAAFAVRDVRVFDGERVAEHRTVLVRDGVVRRIGGAALPAPAGAAVVDGRGRTLLPGLIDAHVHLSDSAEADLRQAAMLGVTTVLDMWTGSTRIAAVAALRSADAPGMAAVRTAGTGATAPGGHPSQMGGPPFPTVGDSTQAAAFVDARIAEGSDYLKIIYDDLASLGRTVPMLDRGTLRALVAAAHARGRLAVVHVLTEAQARDAVEAGADGLAHLFAAPSVSADFARLVSGRGTFVVPTLGVILRSCGRKDGAGIVADTLLRPYVRPMWRRFAAMAPPPRATVASCDGTMRAVRELDRLGAPVLTGTDAPAPGQTYGASVHAELALLVEAGLTPVRALAAATSAPARAFRLADRGRVAPGLRADLLLVDGDPTRDILATRRIVAVWKRGEPVERVRWGE